MPSVRRIMLIPVAGVVSVMLFLALSVQRKSDSNGVHGEIKSSKIYRKVGTHVLYHHDTIQTQSGYNTPLNSRDGFLPAVKLPPYPHFPSPKELTSSHDQLHVGWRSTGTVRTTTPSVSQSKVTPSVNTLQIHVTASATIRYHIIPAATAFAYPDDFAIVDRPLPSSLPFPPLNQQVFSKPANPETSFQPKYVLATGPCELAIAKEQNPAHQSNSNPAYEGLGTLCSHCIKSLDCSEQFICRHSFCVRNVRQIRRCERHLFCMSCDNNSSSCGQFAQCIRGLCVFNEWSYEDCLRVRRRTLDNLWRREKLWDRRFREQVPVATLCSPCLHSSDCYGGRICSSGTCRPLQCKAGFCSVSMRQSLRLCSNM